MQTARTSQLLLAYSVCVTTGLLFTTALHGTAQTEEFDQVTVHRINVVEPDGTPRLVISNHASLPGVIVAGRESAANRPQAGILFYNDEGTENGGLITSGHKDTAGHIVDSGVALSFDKYGAGGQMVQLAGVTDDNTRLVGLRVNDGTLAGPNSGRVFVGNAANGAASVALMDKQGRRRIVMEVAEDGTSSIKFLDASGQTVTQLAPAPAAN